MELTYRPLREADKRAICAWRYGGDCAIYELPPYETLKQEKREFMDPAAEKHYLGFFHGDMLVGYVNLREREGQTLVGVGVAPDLCGRGYGQAILEQVFRLSQERYPGKSLCLEVRVWNRRAIRCYHRAGFRIVGEPYQRVTPTGAGVVLLDDAGVSVRGGDRNGAHQKSRPGGRVPHRGDPGIQ